MKRIYTAVLSVPLAVGGVFLLSDAWFFVVLLAISLLGTMEFMRMMSAGELGGYSGFLLILVPVAAFWMTPFMPVRVDPVSAADGALLTACALVLGAGSIVVFSRTPVVRGLSAIGALTYGVLYFSIPVASLFRLRQIGGPWLVVLCLVIVWLGDIFAYYCGSRWGRSKLAESISPNKTKVGSLAGLLAGLAAATVWGLWLEGSPNLRVLSLAIVVGTAAQMGDLVESLFKRGAGVKDSGTFFPGHGGVMDRLDALFFAAPAAWLFVWFMGIEGLVP